MKALGIDPGTKSFDFCCIKDDVDNVVIDESIQSEAVASDPSKVFRMIVKAGADVIVGPSGYGLEFKHISKFTMEDIALTTLDKVGDVNIPVLSGLRKLLLMMREACLNAYPVPSVILLPTVPAHRKVNKIDMGTADKTCVAAFAVWDHAREYGVSFEEASLICVEMGFGYNAALAVEDGEIIDGVGGTIFPGPGYLSAGQMDGEVAYILGGFSKIKLFEAGTTFIASERVMEPEDFCASLEKDTCQLAWQSMVEGVVKAVGMLLTSFKNKPKEILLTGRLTRVQKLSENLEETLNEKFGIKTRRPKHAFAERAKEAAQGAALIANGIGGGKYSRLIDVMKIREAKGTVLDYIFFPDFDRETVLKSLRSA